MSKKKFPQFDEDGRKLAYVDNGVPVYEMLPSDNEPDWEHKCEVCGQKPVHRLTGMCGPCTFGEADTYGGNW